MGTTTIPSRSDTQTIFAAHENTMRDALLIDIVPRNSSGVATDGAGSLGNASLKWLKAHIESGYWSIGDVKAHHTFNGAAPIGQGWMLCDGRLVNEANYNTEHAAGNWATYIGSSALDGLNLPNMTDKYLVGSASTTQDGTSPLTFDGNVSNQIDNSHTHGLPTHNHEWLVENATGSAQSSFDTGGNSQNLSAGSTKTGSAIASVVAANGIPVAGNSFTDNASPTVGSSQSSTQSIQPESLKVLYFMRII